MSKKLTGASGRDINLGLQGAKDLCAIGRKCIKKDGHDGPCWPTDEKEDG